MPTVDAVALVIGPSSHQGLANRYTTWERGVMVEQVTRDRVDAYWSSVLATSVADLHVPGVRVRPNPPARQSWRGIYVLAFEGACIYAPAEQVDAIAAAVV